MNITNHTPQIWIKRHLICGIMNTIGARAPESGGILLGPVGSNLITDFHFDSTAACTRGTYTPDHVALRRLMRDAWLPAGIDMKGFVHSHPNSFARLSGGDMTYIARLLAKNPDMPYFAAPIVLPSTFSYHAFVVMADTPHVARPTRCRFF